ncbi:MAG: nucleotide exchange factor GrpE [Hyphomicrobiaceae bacterium]
MSDENAKTNEPESAAGPAAPGAEPKERRPVDTAEVRPTAEPVSPAEPLTEAAPAAEAAELRPQDLLQAHAAEVAKLEGQIADLTDRLLRAHADIDNLRKRAEREKAETAKYAISRFAQDTIGVADNFRRAVQAVPPGAADDNHLLKSVLEGIAMIEREYLKVLAQNGVRRIEPVGKPFDANVHQAVMERQDTSVYDNTVAEMFEPGYVIEDRCLRPAIVVVARGGPKRPKEGDEPAANSAQSDNASSAKGDGEGPHKSSGA